MYTSLILFFVIASTANGEVRPFRIIYNGLSVNGSNVFEYKSTETYQTAVYYSNSVSFTKSIKTKPVTAYKTKAFSYQATKQRTVITLRCRNDWEKRKDEDECLKPICIVDCQHGGICSAPDNCTCAKGYTGRYCQTEKNLCTSGNNDCEQECISNGPGKYRCNCRIGYTLNADGHSCDDVDECTTTPKVCGCLVEDGVCNATCNNTIGSYRCLCRDGYRLNSAQKCVDINECLDPKNCAWAQKCINKPGTYECACFKNFEMVGKSCVAKDMCKEDNGGCSDVCKSFEARVLCLCNPRRMLTSDGKTCKDVGGFVLNKTICRNDFIGSLDCTKQHGYIQIVDAFYGRISDEVCTNSGPKIGDKNCVALAEDPKTHVIYNAALKLVKEVCDGMNNCLLIPSPKKYSAVDPCPGVEKYLQVYYQCTKVPE